MSEQVGGKIICNTEAGHAYFHVSLDEMINKLNGMGICDGCSPLNEMSSGFLIPVLNRVYCKECFSEWASAAEFYEEDIEYEKSKTQIFLKALNG